LLSVQHRTSYPVVTEQVEQSWEVSVQAPSKRQKKSGGSRGRPKGSKNRNRREVDLSPSLRFIQLHIKRLLEQIGDTFKVVYFIFDGELGHNDALQMVHQVGLHLISKLRYHSALYLPYDGPYSGRGPRRKYGQKLDYRNMPSEHLKATSIDQEIKTQIYQMSLWHKKFADLLNIVVIVKTNLKTNKTAHVVLFSSDLELGYEHMIDYYRFIRTDLSGYWLLTVVLKRLLIRELEDRFKSKSRASGSIITLGMSPFGVFPQVLDHGLEGAAVPEPITAAQSPKQFR
jgi:DDE superfamily endonuclease